MALSGSDPSPFAHRNESVAWCASVRRCRGVHMHRQHFLDRAVTGEQPLPPHSPAAAGPG